MGYDRNRFINGEVDEELICPICSSVLEDPLQAPTCEHAFCSTCIKEWLAIKKTCPIDRQSLSLNELKPAPRILRNLLSRLSIICDNVQFGCQETIKLETLALHRTECEFNPKRPVPCDKGCGSIITKDEIQNHNCIKELRNYIDKETKKLEQKYDELRENMNSILECVTQLLPGSFNDTNIANIAGALLAPKRILSWCYTLPRARVLRWGGLISTPDTTIQGSVKKSLLESGCPLTTVNELMENSHERKWPPGLSTLEIRQMNRQLFDNYVCRKIPGHQAVVVISGENQHMNDDMILEPGLIMIFAHGIELMESNFTG